MKLTRISKPLRSVQVRVMLAGDLNASLERYARYYEHVHGESVDTESAHSRDHCAFLDADREFQSWSRSSGSGHRRPIPLCLHSTVAPRFSSDWPEWKVARRASHVFTTDTPLIPLDEPCVPERTRSSESGVIPRASSYTRACTARPLVGSTSA